ncbi:MAG: hypothetical protein GY777_26070, partial [Candidatus Brocadiaceae bacterium]|nr:hypothetical protein [Candidatus Brocadiaceae bacterium]
MNEIIIIAVIIVIIVAIIIIGNRFNRRRVRRDNESFDNIGQSVSDTRKANKRLKSGIEKLNINNKSARKRTSDIKQNNRNARDGIKTAKDV